MGVAAEVEVGNENENENAVNNKAIVSINDRKLLFYA
jgi:hypothetical protein